MSDTGASSDGIILGIDFGARRVGLALSPDGRNVFPLRTIAVRSRREAVAKTAEAARREGAARIVVGLPRLASGDLGSSGENALAFVEALRGATKLSVETCDEAYTTVSAEADLQAAGYSPARRRAARDAVAAAAILRAYLDAVSKKT